MTTGKLTKLIEAFIYPEEDPRNYIGASSIGSDCWRQIWYEIKGEKGEGVSNKIRRTWEIGKRLEGLIIDLLKASGIEFENHQVELKDPNLPYFKGHFDGLMINPYAILEIKTAKDASFKIFVRDGCKKWNPKYYAQLQSYMGMSSVFSAYILVLNKDNSEVWDELVLFDSDFYQKLCDKAQMIYEAKIPPPRINGNPLFYLCKQCKFRKVCHK